MNAGRAFDRDMLGGSTGDMLIDNNRFRKGDLASAILSMRPERKADSSASLAVPGLLLDDRNFHRVPFAPG